MSSFVQMMTPTFSALKRLRLIIYTPETERFSPKLTYFCALVSVPLTVDADIGRMKILLLKQHFKTGDGFRIS